jgi:hypothetical protein
MNGLAVLAAAGSGTAPATGVGRRAARGGRVRRSVLVIGVGRTTDNYVSGSALDADAVWPPRT